jgi:uncharacterized protein
MTIDSRVATLWLVRGDVAGPAKCWRRAGKMAGMRKFLGGVATGSVVAALTLIIVSQASAPGGPVAEPVPEVAEGAAAVQVRPAEVADAPVAENAVVADTPVADDAEVAVAAPPQTATAVTPEGALAGATDAIEGAASAAGGPEISGGARVASDMAGADVAAVSAPPAAGTAAIAESPAAVPDLQPQTTLTEGPAQVLQGAGAAESGTVATRPATDTVALLDPQVPPAAAVPAGDPSPGQPDLPPPPPLTPEEEAILADPAQLLIPAEEPPAQTGTDAAAVPEVPALPEPEASPAVVAAPVADPASPVIPAPVTEPEPVTPPVAADSADTPDLAEVADAPAAPQIPEVEQGPSTLQPDQPLGTAGGSTLPAAARLPLEGGDGPGQRLPQVGTAPAPAEAAPLPEVSLTDDRALAQFAAAFANPDAKPLFAVLLIDTGDAAIDRQAVAALPFPVSIVVDPLSPDAASHAALYRAGGKEVVMLASGIPAGATPADLEQTFEAHARVLPEAVAVIDSAAGAFQNDRPLSTQLVPILAAQGRGLLTWDRGLNAADQVARREGLATAMVFRQIDAEGEDVPVMRRYLDRAAFKAAQEGTAMVVGTLRPETLAALLEWTIEGRASTIALAPVSAVLAGN